MIAYKKNYETANDSFYHGVVLSESYVKLKFSSVIHEKIFDTKGTQELLETFSVDETGFDSDALKKIFSLEGQQSLTQEWRIGEAIAEFYLEENHDVTVCSNSVREAKNQSANQTGTDIVGYQKEKETYYFAFGEVKTSSDSNSPPQVVYGKTGLVSQEINLLQDEKTKNQLIRYISVHSIDTKNSYNEVIKVCLKNYIKFEKYFLYGILIRDTNPNEKDLSKITDKLVQKIQNSAMLGMIAVYIPIPMSQWSALFSKEDHK